MAGMEPAPQVPMTKSNFLWWLIGCLFITAVAMIPFVVANLMHPKVDSGLVCGQELSATPAHVVVDGRCDSQPDKPVGIYAEPIQSSQALARAATGAQLPASCRVSGQYIRDADQQGTIWWVRVDLGRALAAKDGRVSVIPGITLGGGDAAYIPDIWVDGDGALPKCD